MFSMPHNPRLRDYPYVVVNVRCQFCPKRQGRYRLVGLVARFGPDILLDDLLARIAADCPRRRARSNQYVVKCHAWFDDLSGDRKPDLAQEPTAAPKPQPTRQKGLRYVIRLWSRDGAECLCEVAALCDLNDAQVAFTAIAERYGGEPITLQEGMQVMAATPAFQTANRILIERNSFDRMHGRGPETLARAGPTKLGGN